MSFFCLNRFVRHSSKNDTQSTIPYHFSEAKTLSSFSSSSSSSRSDISEDLGWAKTLSEDIWSLKHDQQPRVEPHQVKVHYDRACSLGRQSGVTADDVRYLRQPFWNFHMHRKFSLQCTHMPWLTLTAAVCRDSAATTILTIHWNLCMGTIADFAGGRSDLQELLDDLASFRVIGEFMLTELNHGLDAKNLETTATLLPDGTFDLHTPSIGAAKTMPPTTPQAGYAKVAVVFARLIVDGEDRGIKPFIVRLTEEDRMCSGVTSKALPSRSGAKHVDHAITIFDHVKLSSSALLGSIEAAANPRKAFFQQIKRVSVGGVSLSMINIPILRIASYTVAKYSMRRHVANVAKPGTTTPIISFRTQHRPILLGLSQATVFEQYAQWTVKKFMEPSCDDLVRHALVTAFKSVVIRDSQATYNELIDRCGWQGLFPHNTISELMLSMRGNSIAEGDVLVLCIKIATELLQGKYTLPAPKYPKSMLARHEAGLFKELKRRVQLSMLTNSGNRYEAYNAEILPWCKTMVEAIGQRMAYEAALESGLVRKEVIDMFESNCILSYDSSWYVENTSLSRSKIASNDVKAVGALLPLLETLIEETDCAEYATAPIITEERWLDFVDSFETFC